MVVLFTVYGSNICLGQKDRQADKQAVKYANGDWKIANFCLKPKRR